MRQARRSFFKYKWIIMGFFLLSICTSAAFAKDKLRMDENENDYMAKVDGIPITLAEYNRAVQWNKSKIINYFHEKYKAGQTSTFWTTSFGGEMPTEILKKAALDDSVRVKVRQEIAKEQGILKDISYQGFIDQLNQENTRRAKAMANHQVVYGPAQYTEDAYFEYVMTNSTIAVKQNMQLNRLKPDEQTLQSFYKTHKDELYRTSGLAKVLSISISYLDSNQQVDDLKKQQAMKKLEKAYAELKTGAAFEDTAKTYSDEHEQKEMIFNLGNVRQNSRSPLVQAAQKMSSQEITSVIEENGSLYILKCIEKIEPGSAYTAYEEIKEQVLKDYIDYEYEELIRKKLSEVQIVLNESLYPSWEVTN